MQRACNTVCECAREMGYAVTRLRDGHSIHFNGLRRQLIIVRILQALTHSDSEHRLLCPGTCHRVVTRVPNIGLAQQQRVNIRGSLELFLGDTKIEFFYVTRSCSLLE